MCQGDGKSSERMINALIIGCGKIAGYYDNIEELHASNCYSHSAAYHLHDDINIVGYVDHNIEKAEYLADKYKCDYSSTVLTESLHQLRPDVVSVCTPDKSHYEVVIELLNSLYIPKVIFLEKPAFSNSKEFEHVFYLIKDKDVRIVVNQTRRFETSINNLKSLIAAKFFGEIVRIDGWYYSGWMHNGVHFVDTIHYLTGADLVEPEILKCTKSPYEADCNIDLRIYTENDKVPVCINCFEEKYYQLFEFDIKFSEARVRIEDFGKRILYERVYLNEMNEDVLKMIEPDLILSGEGSNSPIYNAISRIHAYFQKNEDLSGIQLRDISKTMKTLWKIQNLIKDGSNEY